MQDVFDNLYAKSSKGNSFNNLMDIISTENNIMLAYRNVRNNKGSRTKGTDGLTILDINVDDVSKFVQRIQGKLRNYHPKSVRRVFIPKDNGDSRPLGIPCMEDRIIQQAIRQVLEPICEAKFHKHSYGFRPNRGVEHALGRCYRLINMQNLHYVVDIDIKSFFDNVDHSKLKKQLWKIGVRDKNLLRVIDKILKSKIVGEGIPEKGTPQGGVISPLLSNIVLNELDWWVSSQWETFETRHEYVVQTGKDGHKNYGNKFRAMKTSNLKEMYLVRYADDFKIFCRDHRTAQRILQATRMWLKERLNLEISPSKSKVTNLRKNSTEFLGFRLRAKPKRGKRVCRSNMTEKAKKSIYTELYHQIKRVQKNPCAKTVNHLNSQILGMQNYYRYATDVYYDFKEIDFILRNTLRIRLRRCKSKTHKRTPFFQEKYGLFRGKITAVANIPIFPISYIKTKPPMLFKQSICNYTEDGRNEVHKNLGSYVHLIEHVLKFTSQSHSVDYANNRVSLIAGQRGKCFITGEMLSSYDMDCHHKIPQYMGGTDEYSNLLWLCRDAHKLIHATKQDTINEYLSRLNLKDKGINRVNSLRKLVGNSVI